MEIPIINTKKAIKVFRSIGYRTTRQTGSHIRLVHDDSGKYQPITIPDHGKTIKPYLLLKIIKDTGLTLEEFKKILKE